MVSVRLPEDLETELDRAAMEEKKSKSSIIKEALGRYLAERSNKKTSYEIGKDLFGMVASGDTDRSRTYKERLKKKLREKRSH